MLKGHEHISKVKAGSEVEGSRFPEWVAESSSNGACITYQSVLVSIPTL